jgi:hypothetical protein
LRHLKIPSLFLFVALLSSCALFNLESPNTWNERLAYVYTLESGAANAIKTQADSGQLSRADANKLVDIVQNAKDITDGARDAMRGGDSTTAEGKLRLARSVLSEVNEYLGERNE